MNNFSCLEVWNQADLKIQSKDAVVSQLELRFPGKGMASDVSRATVTGK